MFKMKNVKPYLVIKKKYMIKTLFVFAMILFFRYGLSAQEVEIKDSIVIQLDSCLDNRLNQSTAGTCNCIYTAADKWDKQMNAVYKKLLQKKDTAFIARLKQAQKAWIVFRDKEKELIGFTYYGQGTMWLPVIAYKVMELNKKRTLELKDMLENTAEF